MVTNFAFMAFAASAMGPLPLTSACAISCWSRHVPARMGPPSGLQGKRSFRSVTNGSFTVRRSASAGMAFALFAALGASCRKNVRGAAGAGATFASGSGGGAGGSFTTGTPAGTAGSALRSTTGGAVFGTGGVTRRGGGAGASSSSAASISARRDGSGFSAGASSATRKRSVVAMTRCSPFSPSTRTRPFWTSAQTRFRCFCPSQPSASWRSFRTSPRAPAARTSFSAIARSLPSLGSSSDPTTTRARSMTSTGSVGFTEVSFAAAAVALAARFARVGFRRQREDFARSPLCSAVPVR